MTEMHNSILDKVDREVRQQAEKEEKAKLKAEKVQQEMVKKVEQESRLFKVSQVEGVGRVLVAAALAEAVTLAGHPVPMPVPVPVARCRRHRLWSPCPRTRGTFCSKSRQLVQVA